MTTFDFGNGPVPAHKHPNGGGWVADTATVAKTAYVGPDAKVFDNARVSGNARVSDTARVYDTAEVGDDVKEDMFIERNGKRYKLVEVE